MERQSHHRRVNRVGFPKRIEHSSLLPDPGAFTVGADSIDSALGPLIWPVDAGKHEIFSRFV